MIELVIGALVCLATLFLCLSIDVVLGQNRGNDPRHLVRPTDVDVDLTGFDVPSDDMDLNLRSSGAKETSVLSESDLIREIRALTTTEVDFDFRELEKASSES
jgi:hypothetical protein